MLKFLAVFLPCCALLLFGCPSVDTQLRDVVDELNLAPLQAPTVADAALFELGQALFFDKELSGNRDMACATCHHPLAGTGDGLSVAVGVGGTGFGPDRVLGAGRSFIPRNSPEVFNRGDAAWTTMFWDNRVALLETGELHTPAGVDLPAGLSGVLAAQALFPPTSNAEMRGNPGDLDVFGVPNELGVLDADDLDGIWQGIMARLVAIDEYVDLFAAAYPRINTEDLHFRDAANAIAAFEADAFALTNTPWDGYLGGDDTALSDEAKRGALLFYTDAGCGECHSGDLLTDQLTHNICAPQVGPGRGDDAPLDLGRAAETGDAAERFAFRTPPLRNVSETGPWMHDGSYLSLEDSVRHHFDPQAAMMSYDPTQLRSELRDSFVNDELILEDMLSNLDPLVAEDPGISDADVADLMAFMTTLTDPAAGELQQTVPDEVPSGLVVDRP